MSFLSLAVLLSWHSYCEYDRFTLEERQNNEVFIHLMSPHMIILLQRERLQNFGLSLEFLFAAVACGTVGLELFWSPFVQNFVTSPHKSTTGRPTQYLIIYI